MIWRRGGGDQKMSKFHDSQNKNQHLKFLYISKRMGVCMGVCTWISCGFDLGRSFDSISVELGRTVVFVENWNCIVLGPNRAKRGSHANSRIFEKGSLAIDFDEIQQINNML